MVNFKNMEEIWKDVVGYEGLYQVSNLGNVKSLNYNRIGVEKILKATISSSGYYHLRLSGKVFRVHQLVVMAFLNHLPCGHKIVVDHINNDKLDNRLENLQLITNRENCSKDVKNKTSKYTGVCWDKQLNKWRVRIYIDGKSYLLGLFICEEEARKVYQNKLKEINEGIL